MRLRYWLGCTTDPKWMAQFKESVLRYWAERVIIK
jgi:hypothetical protein